MQHWLWELWNEPDITYWRGTPEQYYELYDVTSKAIRAVYPDAKVGGPAVTGGGDDFLRGFLQACADRGLPVDFVSFHTKGAHFTPWRTYGPIGAPAPEPQSPSTAKMLREIDTALTVIDEFPQYAGKPVIVDECDASVPAHWGIYDNANFAYRNTEYYPVFQTQLMKKILELNEQHTAKVREATTWSFSMEGERYFEGTRSFVTASGIEKPLMNAYRAFAQLGDRRIGAVVTGTVDALASRTADKVAILVWRHTDDQYAADTTTTRVDLAVEGLEPGRWTLQHFRIDRDHSNSHTVWQALGSPQDPTAEELARITARQGLERFADDTPIDVEQSFSLPLELPLPALSLVVLTKSR